MEQKKADENMLRLAEEQKVCVPLFYILDFVDWMNESLKFLSWVIAETKGGTSQKNHSIRKAA